MSTAPTTVAGAPSGLAGVVTGGGGGWPQRARSLLLGAVFLALVAALAVVIARASAAEAAPRYRTEPVTVGTLVVTVSATGNLEPTNQVDVGSELSGIIERVFVDDNDRVARGQVLAQLGLARLKDAVAQSRANVAAARARVVEAQATVAEARAQLSRFRQVAELSGGRVPSKSEMDTAEATMKRAEASEASARAAVAQATATLQSDLTNLEKAHIRSPIDGVVLDRKVEPGQTVAATFQAPVLFTLAEDLARMELQVDVDEADVSRVEVGQQAMFTVDAWPERRFSAVITRVGYGSQVTDGVVSYLAVLEVDNTDLSLRPGMTGTAEIVTLTREHALLVPNAALRFTPAAEADQEPARSPLQALMPRPPRTTPRRAPPAPAAPGATQLVWVLRDGEPAPLQVKVGSSDGQNTEIVAGPLEAGMAVITEAIGPPA